MNGLTPVRTGTSPDFRLPVHAGEDNWGFKVNGYNPHPNCRRVHHLHAIRRRQQSLDQTASSS
jgi:hypothetical protein